MEEVININGEQYRKVTNKCSVCGQVADGSNGVHLCSGPTTDTITTNGYFEKVSDDGCLWDTMPETTPGSGMKLGHLVCTCKKCSITC